MIPCSCFYLTAETWEDKGMTKCTTHLSSCLGAEPRPPIDGGVSSSIKNKEISVSGV